MNALAPAFELTAEHQALIEEEEGLLRQIQQGILSQQAEDGAANVYQDLMELRDSLGEARNEDVPAIMAQMEQLALITQQQEQLKRTALPDLSAPYFGHLRLQEGKRIRDVLIGSRNCLSPHLPCPIVDWKNAPISVVFYRYREGDEYFEEIGNRELEGTVLARRVLQLEEGRLVRISTGDVVLEQQEFGWQVASSGAPTLAGGSGSAQRPEQQPVRRLGGGASRQEYRVDKHLQQITALIDRDQFTAITHPDSAIVLIQGGAGSGKTTVALHRLAYLLAQQPHYFTAKSVLPVVFGPALARYISKVLPALGVEQVPAQVFQSWVSRLRSQHVSGMPKHYTDHTPVAVIEFKRHPFVLRWFTEEAEAQSEAFWKELTRRAAGVRGEDDLRTCWSVLVRDPLWTRLNALERWAGGTFRVQGVPPCSNPAIAQRILSVLEEFFPEREKPERFVRQFFEDRLLAKQDLFQAAERLAPGRFTPGQLESIWSWSVRQYQKRREAEDEETQQTLRSIAQEHELSGLAPSLGFEEEVPSLDEEDDTLLLLLRQILVSPLRRKNGKRLLYRHLLIDEAQDFSPTEFQLLLSLTPPERRSVTLAGDMDQRIMEGRTHQDWQDSIGQLGYDVTALEPLRIGYRSTYEIMEVAREVIGDLSVNQDWEAVRHGASVETFSFAEMGVLLAFLGDALESLMLREPQASVAVLTRTAEAADVLYEGLQRADLMNLRRIRDQEFPFTAGIEVTDIAQTKGLEFDYVIIADADAGTYPPDPRSRHLLYVGVTRASHQLWLMHTGNRSPLLPTESA